MISIYKLKKYLKKYLKKPIAHSESIAHNPVRVLHAETLRGERRPPKDKGPTHTGLDIATAPHAVLKRVIVDRRPQHPHAVYQPEPPRLLVR